MLYSNIIYHLLKHKKEAGKRVNKKKKPSCLLFLIHFAMIIRPSHLITENLSIALEKLKKKNYI